MNPKRRATITHISGRLWLHYEVAFEYFNERIWTYPDNSPFRSYHSKKAAIRAAERWKSAEFPVGIRETVKII